MLNAAIVQSALELGFIYALVAMALFLSFRVLNIADMTTDGAFTLGCAVSATAAVAGRPVLGLVLAVLAGACAGFVTAFLQTRMGVPSILAGIITNTGLYTVNLAIMGFSSNVPMLKTETVFTLLRGAVGERFPYKLVLAGGISLAGVHHQRGAVRGQRSDSAFRRCAGTVPAFRRYQSGYGYGGDRPCLAYHRRDAAGPRRAVGQSACSRSGQRYLPLHYCAGAARQCAV